MTGIKTFDYSINALRPLQWKENAAANLRALLENKQTWLAQNHTQFWQNFETDIYDLRTANDFGLAVWAIILDFPAFLNTRPASFTNSWGFGTFRRNFNNSNFSSSASGSTEDQALSTEQLRLALRLWFYRLHMDGSVSQTNAILKDLFGHLGNAYVQDNLDMTITFRFDFDLPADLLFVVEQDAIMPISPGVGANVSVSFSHTNLLEWEAVATTTTPRPWAMGIDGANGDLYFTGDIGGDINVLRQGSPPIEVVVSAADNTVTVNVQNLAIDSDNKDLWLTGQGQLSVFRNATAPAISTGFTGGNTSGVAVNPVTHSVYVAAPNNLRADVLPNGITTGNNSDFLSLGFFTGVTDRSDPAGIAYDPIGDRIYVLNYDNSPLLTNLWWRPTGSQVWTKEGNNAEGAGIISGDRNFQRDSSNGDAWVLDHVDSGIHLKRGAENDWTRVGDAPTTNCFGLAINSNNGDLWTADTVTGIIYRSPGVPA